MCFCCTAWNSWETQSLSHREHVRCESLRVLEDVVRAIDTEMVRYLVTFLMKGPYQRSQQPQVRRGPQLFPYYDFYPDRQKISRSLSVLQKQKKRKHNLQFLKTF